MDLLYTILITLATLGILVTIHEYGHFWVARRCGVKVLRFSVGFGRALWRRQGADGTEYVVAMIPLGGYVKMLDEREGEVPADERHRAFNNKPVLSRMAIVAAGPIANFLLAIAAFWVLYSIGVAGLAPVIGQVERESVAAQAGLEPGQEIVSIDGVETPTRQSVAMQLLHRLGESGEISFAVRYPDSDLVYESSAVLNDWLRGADEPDLYGGLGISFWQPEIAAQIETVVEGSPADLAGLKSGDTVQRAGAETVRDWSHWVEIVRAHPGRPLTVELEREGRVITTEVTPASHTSESGNKYGQVGVTVTLPEWPESMQRSHRYAPWLAWRPALVQTAELSGFTLRSIQKMLVGLISPKNLSGPITIAKVATQSAKSGLEAYISFLALLSISLGVLNLLPIPVLDGGHLLYCVVELLKGSPVSERIQMLGYQVGLFILVGVMVLAFYNDISRL